MIIDHGVFSGGRRATLVGSDRLSTSSRTLNEPRSARPHLAVCRLYTPSPVMRPYLTLTLAVLITVISTGCRWGRGEPTPPAKKTTDYNAQLPPGSVALREVPIDQLPTLSFDPAARRAMHGAIAQSLSYLGTGTADKAYARPIAGITKEQVIKGLKQLDELNESSADAASFNAAVKARFRVYESVGCDQRGTVLFTGYYTPIFAASMTPDETYRYPLYRRPNDLVPAASSTEIAGQRQADGSVRPYPARREILANSGIKGTELVWLTNPVEAYIVEVQGSARLRLPSGETMEVGYDGTNGHPYHGIMLDLISEGKISRSELNLASMRRYFAAHPAELPEYTARNPRFVFFTRTSGGPYGSLGRPVTTDLTVATDKAIFPPGAPVVTALTDGGASVRFDQDTGGGIRAAGRCDLYMGVGESAEARAGAQYAEGRLLYLIARD